MKEKSGFLICASEGVWEVEDGVYVYLDGNGNLKLLVEGVIKDTCSVSTDTKVVKVMIVKQKGTYNVFVNGSTSPNFTYTEAQSKICNQDKMCQQAVFIGNGTTKV